MLDVLYLVPYTPTPIRTRPFHLLRGLVERGHRLTLATVWENEAERAALFEWQRRGLEVMAAPLTKAQTAWNSLTALPSRLPLQASFCWQPALAASLHAHLATRPPQIIHVEHLRGARYGLAMQQALRSTGANGQSPPIVWDAVDSISHLFQQASRLSRSPKGRWMTWLELGRTRRFESWLTRQFCRVLVASPLDQQAFERLAAPTSPNSITVLPNGVDLDYFRPPDAPREPATLVLSGKLSYHANVTAALHLLQDIMPLVWRERPDVQVCLAGKDPPRRLCQLAVNDPAHITVTGEVPDIRPYLQRATLAVAPIVYAAGIQNKVLEALACATPVVASSLAVASLTGQPAQALLVADTPPDMAAAILSLLAAPARQIELGRAGRRFVEQHYDWKRTAAQLESIYADALK